MKSSQYLVRRIVTFVAIWLGASMPQSEAANAPPDVGNVRTVALSGQPAPGTPSGVVFQDFNPFYFSLNDEGQVAFRGNLTGLELIGLDNEGIWSEGSGSLSLVARRGSPAPGTPDGVNFGNLQPDTFSETVLNDAGQIAFSASTHEGGFISTATGIWSQRLGALAPVARDGDHAPGTPSGVNFAGFGGLVLNNSGQSAFQGELAGEGVDSANREGIWSEGSGSLTLVARKGSQAIGMPAGVNHDIFGSPVLNDAGQIAFYGYLFEEGAASNVGQAVWSQGSGNLALVTRSGNHAPGTPSGKTFEGFSDPVINNTGHTAFWAYLNDSGQPSDTRDDGIWSEGSGSLSLVARRGSPAPGTPDGVNFGNEQLISFDSPVLNDAGQTAFRGFISGAGVDATNNEGIWSGETGSLALVARAGSQAPGTPSGVNFSSFFPWHGGLELNGAGQVAFTAFLSGDVVPFENDRGIWATDRTGALQLVARRGDLLEVAPGDFRTITALSFVNQGTGNSDGRPSGFNDRGQLAFWARLSGGGEGIFVSNAVAVPEPASLALAAFVAVALVIRRHRRVTALLGVCCVIAVSAPAHAATYTVTDLGALGGTDSMAWAVNNHGQVTGYAATTDDLSIEGFLWTPMAPNSPSGSMLGLESLHGIGSWATGINSSGQVAGVSFEDEEDGDEHATLWIPTTPNGTSGSLHDLGTLGGTYSEAHGINDFGQVSGAADVTGDSATHAFMWKPTMPNSATGTMYDLGSLGGSFTIAWDVNASGTVTGGSDLPDDAGAHAFLWKPTTSNGTSGTMHDLGTLGGSDSDGHGINDSGQVTGYSQTTDDAAYHAFLWTPTAPGGISGAMQDLGTLGGLNSYGLAVIAGGKVAGASDVAAEVSNYTHAFVYTSGSGMIDLNTLIDPLSGWELLDADDVNDTGQITGQGIIGGEYHAYLLTPALPGDFDFDSDVDGTDFLMWQRGESFSSLSSADLADWEANYGADPDPLAAATSAVPESATLVLFGVGLGGLGMVSRRRIPQSL